MCIIKGKVKDRNLILHGVTGYKVALKDLITGKYYSPSTGTEYHKGIIKNVPMCRPFVTNHGNPAYDITHSSYNELMEKLSLTGVLMSREFANRMLGVSKLFHDYRATLKFVLLKMKVRKNLHHSKLEGFGDTILGSNILSIEEIED